jgi:hypothetical protein
MRKHWIALFLLLFICACSPSAEQIEKAIQQTQTADVVSFTETPQPIYSPTLPNIPKNTPRPTRTKKPTESTKLGTYEDPFPAGEWVYLTMTSEGETVDFRIKIEEVIRGDEAWEIIKEANMFNEMPPEGYEPILIKISIRNTSPSGFLSLEKYDISIATKGNVTSYSFYSPCCIDSAGLVEFDAQLNPTGEHSGWIARAVDIDDASPMVIIGADYNGRGGLYFSLP